MGFGVKVYVVYFKWMLFDEVHDLDAGQYFSSLSIAVFPLLSTPTVTLVTFVSFSLLVF